MPQFVVTTSTVAANIMQIGPHLDALSTGQSPNFILDGLKITKRERKHKNGFVYDFIKIESNAERGSFGKFRRFFGSAFFDESQQHWIFQEGGKRKPDAAPLGTKTVKFSNNPDINCTAKTFEREIELSKKLGVRIKQVDVAAKKGRMIMEVFKGITLRSLLDNIQERQKLTCQQRLELCKTLITQLQSIHAHNIIHHDIKPENIMVDLSTSPVTARIFDFGLSAHKNDKRMGRARGSPIYMSPEQLIKDSDAHTEQIDIFALGRVLGEIWGEVNFLKIQNLYLLKQEIVAPQWNDLFAEPIVSQGLHLEAKNMIKNTLIAMLAAEPNNRISLTEVLVRFNEINLKESKEELQLSIIPDAQQPKDDSPRISPRGLPVEKPILQKTPAQISPKEYVVNEQKIADLIQQLEKHLTALEALKEHKTGELHSQLTTLEKNTYFLYLTLKRNQENNPRMYNQALINEINLSRNACQQLIRNNQNLFSQHRNIGYALKELGLVLAGLLVFYLAAGCIHLAVTRGKHFAFFTETKTTNITNKILETTCELENTFGNTELLP